MGRTLKLLLCWCVLGACGCVPAWADNDAAPRAAEPAPIQRENRAAAGWPLGPFKLIDHQGREFTERRLQGKWTFVLFGDSRCAEACDRALTALAGLRERIGSTAAVKAVQIVFVSLQPDRDTAQRLRQYLQRFDPAFIGATGSPSVLDQLAREAGVAEAGSLLLIGPDGVIRVEYLPPFDVKRLTAEVLKTRARG